jgi:group I intron endonuclease
MSIIYKTTNLVNNLIYVGQHWTSADNYLGSGIYLKKAIKEFGKENFKREILEYCISENQHYIGDREYYWIETLSARNQNIGYNVNNGGIYGSLGIKRSKDFKRKISNAQKGKKLSEKIKRKISESLSGKNCYWYGKHHSDKSKEKMKESAKKRIRTSLSDQTKLKISLANKGRKRSIESKQKMSESRKNYLKNKEFKK